MQLREAIEELPLPLGRPQIGSFVFTAGWICQHRLLLLLLAGFSIRTAVPGSHNSIEHGLLNSQPLTSWWLFIAGGAKSGAVDSGYTVGLADGRTFSNGDIFKRL